MYVQVVLIRIITYHCWLSIAGAATDNARNRANWRFELLGLRDVFLIDGRRYNKIRDIVLLGLLVDLADGAVHKRRNEDYINKRQRGDQDGKDQGELVAAGNSLIDKKEGDPHIIPEVLIKHLSNRLSDHKLLQVMIKWCLS